MHWHGRCFNGTVPALGVFNLVGEGEIKGEKSCSMIEQLQHLLKCWLSCIDFSTHYKNTYMFKTADVDCSEITFFPQ